MFLLPCKRTTVLFLFLTRSDKIKPGVEQVGVWLATHTVSN